MRSALSLFLAWLACTALVGGTALAQGQGNTSKPGQTKLPFEPRGIVVSSDQTRVAIWDGEVPVVRANSPLPPPPVAKVAIVEVETGKVLATRQFKIGIKSAALVGEYLAVWPYSAAGPSRVEVLSLDGLEPVRTLVVEDAVNNLHGTDKFLIASTSRMPVIFSLPAFEVVDDGLAGLPYDYERPVKSLLVTDYGIYAGGTLFDQDLKPKLQHAISAHFSVEPLDRSVQQLRKPRPLYVAVSSESIRRSSTWRREFVTELPVPTAGTKVKLVRETNWALKTEGLIELRQLLPVRAEPGAKPPMVVVGATVYVAPKNLLFAWRVPGSESRFVILPKQSELAITGDARTVLQHKVRGGKQPITYALDSDLPGMKIDKKTGTVSIENAAIQERATEVVMARIRRFSLGYSSVKALLEIAWGRRARGSSPEPTVIKFNVPIRISATDAEGVKAELDYYLRTEVAMSKLMRLATKRDKLVAAQVQKDNRRIKELDKALKVLELEARQAWRAISEAGK